MWEIEIEVKKKGNLQRPCRNINTAPMNIRTIHIVIQRRIPHNTRQTDYEPHPHQHYNRNTLPHAHG